MLFNYFSDCRIYIKDHSSSVKECEIWSIGNFYELPFSSCDFGVWGMNLIVFVRRIILPSWDIEYLTLLSSLVR